MKTSFHRFSTANLLSLGALVVFAGCTSAPLRQSTLPTEYESLVSDVLAPGYEAPVAIQTVTPDHPWEMRRAGITGEVDLNLVIDENGRVVDAQVESSSDPGFEQSALTAVKKWTFKPASQNGVAVMSRANLPIKFEFSPDGLLRPID